MTPTFGDLTVFFGCSMRGGDPFVLKAELAEFPGIIRTIGCKLASDHQTQPGILQRELTLDPPEIHDRDYRWLMQSDLGVFEISNPSLGAGGEISDMIHLGKPVLLLYRQGIEQGVSAYIRGKQGSCFVQSPVACYAYRDLNDARAKIQEFIGKHLETLRAIGR